MRRLVALDGDRAETHSRLAIALFRSGNAQGALEHFERAQELEPNNREAVENLILVLDRLGRANRAAQYRKLLESMPEEALSR